MSRERARVEAPAPTAAATAMNREHVRVRAEAPAPTAAATAMSREPARVRAEAPELTAAATAVDREPARVETRAPAAAPQPSDLRLAASRAAGRVRGTVGLGLGAAALLTGAVTGLFSASITSTEKSRCNDGHCPLGSSGPLSDATTLANASNVSFAVGGIAVAYGLYELLTLPSAAPQEKAEKASARVELGPGTVRVHARF
jgi:hypothetical protein